MDDSPTADSAGVVARRLVKRLLLLLSNKDVRDSPRFRLPEPVWGSAKGETFANFLVADDAMRVFYNEIAPKHAIEADVDHWRALVRTVFCLPESSAEVESLFSGAGRLDGPLRTQMSAETLEKSIVVSRWARTRPNPSAWIDSAREACRENTVLIVEGV